VGTESSTINAFGFSGSNGLIRTEAGTGSDMG
jgi:hypothetical protein